MSKKSIILIAGVLALGGLSFLRVSTRHSAYAAEDPQIANAEKMIHKGRGIFRFDTFGDEAFWGDSLKLHEAIDGAKLPLSSFNGNSLVFLGVGLHPAALSKHRESRHPPATASLQDEEVSTFSAASIDPLWHH